jgi:hypothetical protein
MCCVVDQRIILVAVGGTDGHWLGSDSSDAFGYAATHPTVELMESWISAFLIYLI